MKTFVLLIPLLAACASTHPPSCDGANKHPVNASTAVIAPLKAPSDDPGPLLSGRWRVR